MELPLLLVKLQQSCGIICQNSRRSQDGVRKICTVNTTQWLLVRSIDGAAESSAGLPTVHGFSRRSGEAGFVYVSVNS